MHRRGVSKILRSEIKASFFKEQQRNRLIPLGSCVKHIDSKVIATINVSFMFNKQGAQVDIAFKRAKVKCSESFIVGLVIYVG
jgi:hypothetical protein